MPRCAASWWWSTPRELWAAWRERGLFAADTPAYRIADAPLFHALLGDLVRRLPGVDEPWEVERVDRLCELLAFTAATNLAPQRVPRRRDPLATIRHELQRRAFERIDVEALAVAQGMSPSTFRRRWRSRYGLSPMGFVQQARMAEACRLLVETSEPVARIAARVGYDDPLYFSRVFSQGRGRAAQRAPQAAVSGERGDEAVAAAVGRGVARQRSGSFRRLHLHGTRITTDRTSRLRSVGDAGWIRFTAGSVSHRLGAAPALLFLTRSTDTLKRKRSSP